MQGRPFLSIDRATVWCALAAAARCQSTPVVCQWPRTSLQALVTRDRPTDRCGLWLGRHQRSPCHLASRGLVGSRSRRADASGPHHHDCRPLHRRSRDGRHTQRRRSHGHWFHHHRCDDCHYRCCRQSRPPFCFCVQAGWPSLLPVPSDSMPVAACRTGPPAEGDKGQGAGAGARQCRCSLRVLPRGPRPCHRSGRWNSSNTRWGAGSSTAQRIDGSGSRSSHRPHCCILLSLFHSTRSLSNTCRM